MSLDLSWSSLDSTLATSLLGTLNKALSTATRPDFLGPLTLTSFDFGTESPDVHIVDIGDVWREFMSDAPDGGATAGASAVEGRGAAGISNASGGRGRKVSGSGQGLAKFAENNLPFAGGATTHANGNSVSNGMPARVQTFRQYGDGTPMPAGTPAASNWDAGSVFGGPHQTTQYGGWQAAGLGVAMPTPASASARGGGGYFGHWRGGEQMTHASHPAALPTPGTSARPQIWRNGSSFPTAGDETEEEEENSTLPSLQLHLSLDWSTTTLRLTLSTSLLINHPSPAFMALPLEITLTALVLQAGALIAFESSADGKRVHLCLIEEERMDESDSMDQHHQLHHASHVGGTAAPLRTPMTSSAMLQPPSLGERLIPHLALESSVGQSDKHTLVNVGKVERFVQELIRKAVVDELVFPSAYTLEIP